MYFQTIMHYELRIMNYKGHGKKYFLVFVSKY